MENYSRSNKNKTKSSKKPTKQHIKTGLSAFQKTIATVAKYLVYHHCQHHDHESDWPKG